MEPKDMAIASARVLGLNMAIREQVAEIDKRVKHVNELAVERDLLMTELQNLGAALGIPVPQEQELSQIMLKDPPDNIIDAIDSFMRRK